MKVIAAVAVVGAVLSGVIALASCVIADPPPDLPNPPHYHPVIVRGSVWPPPTQILASIPSKFLVPVDVFDPNAPFAFHVFIDFDPTDDVRRNAVYQGNVSPTPASLDGGVFLVDFDISSMPPDPSGCHVIEFVVAFGFDPLSPHTPDSNGGDSVAWFYNPSGDPSMCPRYDAGIIDGALPDMGPGPPFMPEGGTSDGGAE